MKTKTKRVHSTVFQVPFILLAAGLLFSQSLVLPAAAETGAEASARILAYTMDVQVSPTARTDYRGLLKILYGEDIALNKADSEMPCPHMLARARMTIDLGPAPRRKLTLFLQGELRGHRLLWQGKPLEMQQRPVFYPSYSMVADRITVELPGLTGRQVFELTYGGLMHPSCAATPSNYMRIDTRGAYLRGAGYSLWFPTTDQAGEDSGTVDFQKVTIHTPPDFRAVFTGTRLGETDGKGERITTWEALNLRPRDVQLAVRPYQLTRDGNIFLYHLDDPASRTAAGQLLKFIARLRAYYRDHYHEPSGSSQLHLAQLPNFASGISAGNMIGITSAQWCGFSTAAKDDYLERLVSHELVHPYVQTRIPQDGPLAALFIEGFPSYFHYPALAEIRGEEWYRQRILSLQKAYLKSRQSGTDRRGNPLPPEKPISRITFSEIGRYKDRFVLNDRVSLFLDYLRRHMGKAVFRTFTRELCGGQYWTVPALAGLAEKNLPGAGKAVSTWLETTSFPEDFRLTP